MPTTKPEERNVFTDRFLDLLNDKMQETGMTLADIAKESSVSKPALSNYQNDRQKPGFENLDKIATYFNVSLDYLAGRTDVPNPIIEDIAASQRYGLTDKALFELLCMNGFFDYDDLGISQEDCKMALRGINLLIEFMPLTFFIAIIHYFEHDFDMNQLHKLTSPLFEDFGFSPHLLEPALLTSIQLQLMEERNRYDNEKSSKETEKLEREKKKARAKRRKQKKGMEEM